MNKLVSVIIPCYNYGHYLGEAIQSLQAQQYTNWECIIVDDGSRDATAAIAKEFAAADVRIKYFYQPNQGQPAARNNGIRQACGSFVQFLDADDLLQPGKLSTQVAYLDSHPEADIVYSDVMYFRPGAMHELFRNRWDAQFTDWMPRVNGKGKSIVAAMLASNIFELGCALFRRDALDATGFFDEDLKGVEDYDLCLRSAILLQEFHYHAADNDMVLMRHHSGSYSKGLVRMYKKELQMRAKAAVLIRQAFPGNRDLLRINRLAYGKRLRMLHNLLIDGVIKGNKHYLDWPELKWQWRYSGLKGMLYFFPRIAKAQFLQ
jgi:glycosyltransferase involved in cell wall biosynthesis